MQEKVETIELFAVSVIPGFCKFCEITVIWLVSAWQLDDLLSGIGYF
jgi:hypothetical protein